MKILLKLFVLAALALSISCSKDDNNEVETPVGNELKITLDGTEYIFNSIIVEEHVNNLDESIYYEITATINGNSSRIISFFIYKDEIGANAFRNFRYITNEGSFPSGGLNDVTSVNNGSRITATFSGYLIRYNVEIENYENFPVTNGSIDVSF